MVFIMIGTNAVRKDKDGIKTANKILEIAGNITRESEGNTIPVLVTAPPLSKNRYMINVQEERKILINFIKTISGKAIAKSINKMTQNLQKGEIKQNLDQIDTMKQLINAQIKIEQESIKHIIGKGGEKIKVTENKHKVNISTLNNEARPYKSIRISGYK